MDTTNTAGQSPAATPRQSEAEAFMSAGGGFDPNMGQRQPEPQTQEVPVADAAPVVQSEQGVPEASQTSADAPESSNASPSEPVIDPAIVAEFELLKAQRDQSAQELQQWQQQMIAAQRQQQMMQVEQQRQERINQAEVIAQNMADSGDSKGSTAYLRRFYDDLRLTDANVAQAAIANQRVQAEQMQHRLLAKPYAEHLVQQHQLPKEYVELLAQHDGRTQDSLVQTFVARERQQTTQTTARERELEQRLRDLEANAKAGNPAFNPGGSGAGAAPPQSQRPSNPREAEIWDYQNAPVMTR